MAREALREIMSSGIAGSDDDEDTMTVKKKRYAKGAVTTCASFRAAKKAVAEARAAKLVAKEARAYKEFERASSVVRAACRLPVIVDPEQLKGFTVEQGIPRGAPHVRQARAEAQAGVPRGHVGDLPPGDLARGAEPPGGLRRVARGRERERGRERGRERERGRGRGRERRVEPGRDSSSLEFPNEFMSLQPHRVL
jgi:hypothetical protein